MAIGCFAPETRSGVTVVIAQYCLVIFIGHHLDAKSCVRHCAVTFTI